MSLQQGSHRNVLGRAVEEVRAASALSIAVVAIAFFMLGFPGHLHHV